MLFWVIVAIFALHYLNAPGKHSEYEPDREMCPECEGTGWIYTPEHMNEDRMVDASEKKCFRCEGMGLIDKE